MQTPDMAAATVEYRCVLVRPGSHRLLTVAAAGQYRVPRVQVPRWTRPAQEIQKAVKARWALDIFVLHTSMPVHGAGGCAMAELRTSGTALSFVEIPVDQLNETELSGHERCDVTLLFEGRGRSPFSRIGWIDEAVVWFESATSCTISAHDGIEQWNAGAGFALLRMHAENGRRYWLKATGEPNVHEFLMTRLLSETCPDFVPKLVATKTEWNAWLTEDAGYPLSDPPSSAELLSAAKRLASLQVLTVGKSDELLAAGAFDQRLSALRGHIDEVIAYLIEAMAKQKSTKAAPLSRDRLLDLGEILGDACFRLEALGIPDALIHNDLNPGNILSDGANYVFTDWSEAVVGNPFLTCERLCQLNRAHRESVRNVYRECWSHRLSAHSMDEAIALTRLLAIYAYLYGRGDWIAQGESVRPQFESYARSLARHMDRAARDVSLLEILCH